MVRDRVDPDGLPSADSARVLRGILALLAADRDERVEGSPPRRSELVLAEAGLTHQEIAGMTGKNAEAVRSLLRRNASSRTVKGAS